MNDNFYIETELTTLGYKGKFTSITHINELKSEILGLREKGKLNDKIFNDYLQFDYDELKEYKSMIIVAMKLPVVILEVEKNDVTREIMIPSAYYSGGQVESFNKNMETLFRSNSINYKPVHLPCKLLVARTGLGAYGRNNISYIDGFGSYFRARVFLTDVDIREDNWNKVRQSELCASCSVCIDGCPNDLISTDSYLIDAGKCITFHNEIEDDFPTWINPKWHNALIGCMKCQYDCPINIEYKRDMKVISRLTEENVEDIFRCISYDELNDDTKRIIRDIEFDDYYKVFKRNFESVYSNL